MKTKRVQSQTSAVVIEVSSVSVKEARGAVCIPEKEEGLSQDKDYFSAGVRTIPCQSKDYSLPEGEARGLGLAGFGFGIKSRSKRREHLTSLSSRE